MSLIIYCKKKIDTDLNALENSMYAPSPQRPVPKEEKLEGIETILGIKKK